MTTLVSRPDHTATTEACRFPPFRLAKAQLTGARKLTRAHLSLTRRSELLRAFGLRLAAVCNALSSQLGTQVAVTASVLENVFVLEKHLVKHSAFALFELDASGGVAVLELEMPLLGAALERLSGGPGAIGPVTRLTRIEEAAFGFLSLLILQSLRAEPTFEQLFAPRLRGVTASLDEALAAVDPGSSHLGIRLAVQIGNAQGQGRLFLPARFVKNALEQIPETNPGPVAREILAAELQIRAFAGRLRLDLDEVRSLEVGDVLLFDDLQLSAGALSGPIRLVSTAFELSGLLTPEGFKQESSMSHPSPRDETPVHSVEVEVELTRIRMTVADLAQIRPGSLMPLRVTCSEPVLLRLGDRGIAKAELVELEGEVGARILSLIA